MAPHFSILAWEIPWTEDPGRLQSMGLTKESDMVEQLNSNNTKAQQSSRNSLYLFLF